MDIFRACRCQADHRDAIAERVFGEAFDLELYLAKRYSRERRFSYAGTCKVCDRATDFEIGPDGAQEKNGVWHPDWRERLVCTGCGLNSRQRCALAFVRAFLLRPGRPRIYLMEQTTPLFARCASRFGSEAEIVGSEYLGVGHAGGAVIDGIRHEDAEHLSFPDGAFDLVISNDVLEHVPSPTRALAEMSRVLVPGGQLFLTTPFELEQGENRVRATLRDGQVIHHAPPQYHENPLSASGSLVFTDFGWEILETMRSAGFADAAVNLFWSLQYGHLGVPEMFFLCGR